MQTVLITGGFGLVGKELSTLLSQKGFRVNILSRKKSSQKNTYHWNVANGFIEKEAIASADYIIHLAGENIATKRWTSYRKKALLESRVLTTKLLLEKVKEYNPNLKRFISASAVGYYGTTSDKFMTEESACGNDFLSEICVAWEKEAQKFQEFTRVAILRIGVVLSGRGGAYAEIAKPIKLGFGAVLGSGKQSVPWIHISDLCRIFSYIVENEKVQGIYNAVAPEQINQTKLTQCIASSLRRKIYLPNAPSFFLKWMLGERSVILLKGTRVSPQKIIDMGFEFEFPSIENAVDKITQSTKK